MFVATIGFFDGVHCGHRYLISRVIEEARKLGLSSMAITMDRHPKTIVDTDYVPSLLSTTEERISLLKSTGIDRVEVLGFDLPLSKMRARDFMEQVLRNKYGVSILVMGYDHRFGHDGGSHEDYVRWGQECGIKVIIAPKFDGIYASSSEVRRQLEVGDVISAAKLLGHPYVLTGIVRSGHQVGRTLGFPTANLDVEQEKLIPACGVYAVETDLGHGIMNIGRRPTVNNGNNISIEVHIMDYAGDLYGKRLQLHFIERIREEIKFSSLEELRCQIREDILKASAMFDALEQDV